MEHRGRAVTLVGVEVDDQHPADFPLFVQGLRRQGCVGIHAEAASPARGRMVITAAEVDRDPVFERQAAGQYRAAGGVPHRPQDAPVDQPSGQPTHHGHLEDARQDPRAAQRLQILRRVDFQQVGLPSRARAHEVPAATKSPGDQRVVDAAVLPAVERVQPLQTEGRDVVRRVVDERNSHFGILARPIGDTIGTTSLETRTSHQRQDRDQQSTCHSLALSSTESHVRPSVLAVVRGGLYGNTKVFLKVTEPYDDVVGLIRLGLDGALSSAGRGHVR